MSTAIKRTPKFCYVDAMGGAPIQDDGSGPEIYVRGASSVALMMDFLIEFNDGTLFYGTPESAEFTSDAQGDRVKITVRAGAAVARVDVARTPDGKFSLGAVIGTTITKPVMYPMDAGGIRLQ